MVEFGLSRLDLESPAMTERFMRTPEQRQERLAVVDSYTSGFKGKDLDAMVNTDLLLSFMLGVELLIEGRHDQLKAEAAAMDLHGISREEMIRASTEDILSSLRAMDEAMPRPSLDHLVAEGVV